jgi:hypothetical protein
MLNNPLYYLYHELPMSRFHVPFFGKLSLLLKADLDTIIIVGFRSKIEHQGLNFKIQIQMQSMRFQLTNCYFNLQIAISIYKLYSLHVSGRFRDGMEEEDEKGLEMMAGSCVVY